MHSLLVQCLNAPGYSCSHSFGAFLKTEEMYATLACKTKMDAQCLNFMACLVWPTCTFVLLFAFNVHLQFGQLHLPCAGNEEHT